MSRAGRRKWAPDTLALREAYDGKCRVCGERIHKDDSERVWRFFWTEERGQGHADCGFWSLTGGTDDDARAITCARALLSLKAYAVVPLSVSQEGRELALVTKGDDGDIRPTAIAFALFKHLRAAPPTAPASPARSANGNPVVPAFQVQVASASCPARRGRGGPS